MQNIIVTGAARGIGCAIAETLLADGYAVIAVDRELVGLEQLHQNHPQRVAVFQCDVADCAAVAKLFNALDPSGLYGLVNNAGVYYGKGILDYHAEEIQQLLNVNLLGAIYFSQCFGKALLSRESEGVIVNISSSSIYGGSDPVYSASKAGLVGLSKACAVQFSPFIRVNAVAPGIVATDMSAAIPPTVTARYRESELVKHPLQANDVANTVRFLFGAGGRHYSGAVFDLNNGFHL